MFEREIFSACAAAALYRRSILDEIGYLDENFFAYRKMWTSVTEPDPWL
jgi:GT2 family glycosyltransferase